MNAAWFAPKSGQWAKRFRLLTALLTAASAATVSWNANAQTETFYLDRAQISGAPDDGFMVWRPYMHEETRFYGTAALGFSLNPLRADNVTDDPATKNSIDTPVQGQINTYLAVGTEVAKRVGFQIMLPIVLYQFMGDDPAGEGVGLGGLTGTNTALMDLRLDLRVRAYESDSRKFRLGLGGSIWAPTGNPTGFASDDGATGWLYGSGEYDFDKFFITGHIGPHFRPNRSIGGANGDLAINSELRWAAGAFMPLRDKKLRVGVELWGTTGIADANTGNETYGTFFAGRNTTLEWLAQARFLLDEKERIYANVGGGTRLSNGYGAADIRVLASIGTFFTLEDFEPASPPPRITIVPDVEDYDRDRDGDGYPDSIDKCPDDKEDGKPPDPTDGCPAGADRDGDGIPDAQDKCPDHPEDKDGVEDEDGCPEEDADNDSIPDGEDKCPTEPGPRSDIAEKNGCPSLTRVEEDGTVSLLEPIQFEYNSATIKPVSFPILDEVVALMKARPSIRMGVYGHTDNVGGQAYNLRLSKQRAASVMQYLIGKGIDKARLESEGFGPNKPITSNATPEGRAKNRRVEFKILSE